MPKDKAHAEIFNAIKAVEGSMAQVTTFLAEAVEGEETLDLDWHQISKSMQRIAKETEKIVKVILQA